MFRDYSDINPGFGTWKPYILLLARECHQCQWHKRLVIGSSIQNSQIVLVIKESLKFEKGASIRGAFLILSKKNICANGSDFD